jgi:hypothetical protein
MLRLYVPGPAHPYPGEDSASCIAIGHESAMIMDELEQAQYCTVCLAFKLVVVGWHCGTGSGTRSPSLGSNTGNSESDASSQMVRVLEYYSAVLIILFLARAHQAGSTSAHGWRVSPTPPRCGSTSTCPRPSHRRHPAPPALAALAQPPSLKLVLS